MTFYADMENGFLLLLFDMIYLASEYRIKKDSGEGAKP